MASEMLYPVMPLYLKEIGYTALFIGILEGLAEAVAGLSKPYFGKWSDGIGRRLPFVQLGYALSSISKPMLALFTYPWWIFLSRTTDRVGKGIRTGARDALLSDECTKQTRATVFGFHRSMDTIGAVLGPAIALVYLYFYPNNYKALFLIAFVPGLLAVFSSFLIKEKHKPVTGHFRPTHIFSFLSYWKQAPGSYKKLLIGLLAFALINSSDVFLILKMKETGMGDAAVIGMYIFYNLLYALLAFPAGILADRLGVKKIFISGLLVFAIAYAGFGITSNLFVFMLLLALYGFYAAATEGIAKAWISNLVPRTETATAIGTYSGLQSICALLASSICGLIWFKFGAALAFTISAVAALAVAVYLGMNHFKNQEPVLPN